MPKLVNKPHKYNNVKIHFDLERDSVITKYYKADHVVTFDSMLEYNVYMAIRSVVKAEKISIHKPILIWDKTMRFPVFDWKVDFTIHTDILDNRGEKTDFYIEAKGICTDDFVYRLRAIDYLKPHLIPRMIFATQVKRKITGYDKTALWSVELEDVPNQITKLIRHFERQQLFL